MNPVQHQVFNALEITGAGSTPRSVSADVQNYSPVSVRHALRELVKAGHARREGREGDYRYWRVPAQT